jgi:hypothetical protein
MDAEEIRKTMDATAVFINRVTVSRTAVGTRISFAEEVGEDIRYRIAVMLPDETAKALCAVLNQVFPPAGEMN